jgi:ribosome-binding factor A
MHERLQEALRETAAEFLSREASRQSLITVTRATLAENDKSATIYITVFPDSAEEAALAFANRSRRELAHYFESRIRGAKMPHVTFMIDRGEKSRQRLDELTK